MERESFIEDSGVRSPSIEERADWIYKEDGSSERRGNYDVQDLLEEDVDVEGLGRDDFEDLANEYGILSGKWVIECLRKGLEVDFKWNRVKEMMAEEPVHYSKVSTRLQSDKFHKMRGESVDPEERKHVICVYTKDFRDKEDVMEVQEILRDWDLEPKGYKEDLKTVLGIYSDAENLNEFRY